MADDGLSGDHHLSTSEETPPSSDIPNAVQRNKAGIQSAEHVLLVMADRSMIDLFSGLALDHSIFTPEYDYTDTPLDDCSHIRLLRLFAGNFKDDLRCEISTANIHEANHEPYEAVSYMWKNEPEYMAHPDGIALRTDTIFCQNGTHLKISRNLNNLLRRLRCVDGWRALWIDQICINQEDEDEKFLQIPLMQAIYEKSAQVLLWIGEEDEHTEPAFALVGKIWEVTWKKPLGDYTHPQALLSSKFTEFHGLPPFPGAEWEALAHLFKRRVYRRAWIIQEVTLNRTTEVICGSKQFPFSALAYAADFLVEKGWVSLLIHQYGSETRPIFLATLFKIWIRVHGTREGQGITRLICSTRRFASTLPEDKVYALTGLAKRGQKALTTTNELPAALVPKKGKSSLQVFRDITIYSIMSEGSLEILSTKQDPSLTETPGLPSWVPDFVVWPQVTILGIPKGIPYTASGDSVVDADAVAETKLCARGSVIDTIATLGNLWHAGDHWRDRFKDWFEFIETNLSIPPGSLVEGSFWRGIIGNYDRSNNQYPATEDYATHFNAMIIACFGHKYSQERGESAPELGDAGLYLHSFQFISYLRRIFISKNGRIGLAPESAMEGDEILIMSGGRVPFVVRKLGGADDHELIAECYLHGVMDGEVVEAKGFAWGRITLV